MSNEKKGAYLFSNATPAGEREYFIFPEFKKPISTAINVEAVQQGLRNVGLTCAQNNPENILLVDKQIQNAVPEKGLLQLMSSPKVDSDDYDYVLDPANEYWSQMNVILANLEAIEQNKVYYISKHHKENTFESSTMGTISTVFTSAASIIGDLGNGHADPAQISATLGDDIAALTETEKKSYHQTDEDAVFLSAAPNEKGESVSVAGVYYKYEFFIDDYKDKKKETHKSEYDVLQRNVVFTSPQVFRDVYNWVIEHLKNAQ